MALGSEPGLNYNGAAARKLPALRRRYAAVLAFWAIPEAEGPFPASIEAARRPLVRHLGGRNSAKTPPPPLLKTRVWGSLIVIVRLRVAFSSSIFYAVCCI